MARLLILGGGCRGRRLAAALASEGHATRIVTRSESGREAIESARAECWIGTPDRLATLRGALDGVTIACWLLATARGDEAQLRALHGPRLQAFLAQAIDTTMRGFIYEAPCGRADVDAGGDARMEVGAEGDERRGAGMDEERGARTGVGGSTASGATTEWATAMVADGERVVRAIAARNAIPAMLVRADPGDLQAWLTDARQAIGALLGSAGSVDGPGFAGGDG